MDKKDQPKKELKLDFIDGIQKNYDEKNSLSKRTNNFYKNMFLSARSKSVTPHEKIEILGELYLQKPEKKEREISRSKAFLYFLGAAAIIIAIGKVGDSELNDEIRRDLRQEITTEMELNELDKPINIEQIKEGTIPGPGEDQLHSDYIDIDNIETKYR